MQTKQRLIIAALLVIVALLVGCQPAMSSVTNGSYDEIPMATQASGARGLATEQDKGGAAPAADAYSDAAAVTQQMIIRTVNMTMVVDDVEKSAQELMAVIGSYQGYVAGSNLWHEGEQTYANLTLRVPAESLDALLAILRSKAVRILTENISTQDVSQEYVDLDSRLRNLEATEQELLKVLANIYEKSYKAEDVLAIYREITQIRGEIEQVKGRQQYLEQLTALATVQVTLQPVATPPSVVEGGKWNPMVAVNTSLRNLVNIMQGLYEVVVVIILNVIPVLVLLALPVLVVILIVRSARRRKARKQPTPQD